MAMLEDVKALLVAEGLASNLFLGNLPESPPSAAALYQYSGRPPLFVHDTPGISLDRPSLQLQVRDSIYATAFARAQAIYELLASVANEDLNGVRYLRFEPLGAPFLLQRDANHLTIIGANFYASRAP